MKKLIFLNLMVGLSQFSFSQEYEYIPFPTNNAIWSEVFYYPMNSSLWPQCEYRRFAINGEDTIIESVQYKKMFMFSDSVFNKNTADYIGGIREDTNKRVFYTGKLIFAEFDLDTKGDTSKSEYQIYDFSADVGDTIQLDVFMNFNYIVVKGIDTINFLGRLRRVYSFQNYSWVYWVEGIGNVKGILFSSDDLPTNALDNNLVCFEEDGLISYFYEEYGSCRPKTDLLYNTIGEKENVPAENEIWVTPNPGDGAIKINFANMQTGTIKIITTAGIVVLQKKILKTSELQIDLTGNRGLMLLYFTNSENKTVSAKFMIY